MTTNDSAQAQMEELCKAKPVKEHEWLTRLVGEWSYQAEAEMGPDKPKMKTKGEETVRSLGGLWIIAEGWGEMPDGERGETRMTVGYDPKTKRYPGTWVGSMMTHMWVYDGEMDKSGKILTLNAQGPSFMDPSRMAKFQDIIEIVSDDHRILRSQFETDSGEWIQFMTANYRRK